MPLAHVQNYGNSQLAVLGFGLMNPFLMGLTASYPVSNLPRREVARYGNFPGTAANLVAFPVRWGKRYGMAAYNLIVQTSGGQVNWPYGNGLT